MNSEVVKSAVIISRSWGLQYADSQDLAQELLLLALRIENMPLAYVRKAMKNRAIDFLRERNRKNRGVLPLEAAFNIPSPKPNFTSELLQIERARKSLSKVQRLVLAAIAEGRSMRESASFLGVSRAFVSGVVKKISREAR